MFFFILIIFRLLYIIIQFSKALKYSSLLRVQIHSKLEQFTLVRKGYDNHHLS